MILSFLAIFNCVLGQPPQTIEDINKCKQLKIKSIRTSVVNYVEWASLPEGQVSNTNPSTSLRLFDTTGRLVKEYTGIGAKYLRNIYYDSNGRIDRERWLYSKLQIYPNSIEPKTDSDYTEVYKEINYHYSSKGRLDSTTTERRSKSVFQYNDSGYLISTMEIEPSGFVRSFEITKYGFGINWGKIVYKAVNHYTETILYEYEYEDRKLVKRKIIYDNGKKSITYYNDKEQETTEDLYDKNDKLVAKFEYMYNQFGLAKVTSRRLPAYKSWSEPKTDKLRISEVEIYAYETY